MNYMVQEFNRDKIYISILNVKYKHTVHQIFTTKIGEGQSVVGSEYSIQNKKDEMEIPLILSLWRSGTVPMQVIHLVMEPDNRRYECKKGT